MQQSEILMGIAQLSIALVGFAGLVAVFIGPKGGGINRVSRFRIQTLIELGLLITIIAIMPIILFELGFDEASAWRFACAIFFLVFAITSIIAIRRIVRMRREIPNQLSGRIVAISFSFGVSAIVLTGAGSLNFWPELNSGFFILALILGLVVPALAFYVMVTASRNVADQNTQE